MISNNCNFYVQQKIIWRIYTLRIIIQSLGLMPYNSTIIIRLSNDRNAGFWEKYLFHQDIKIFEWCWFPVTKNQYEVITDNINPILVIQWIWKIWREPFFYFRHRHVFPFCIISYLKNEKKTVDLWGYFYDNMHVLFCMSF